MDPDSDCSGDEDESVHDLDGSATDEVKAQTSTRSPGASGSDNFSPEPSSPGTSVDGKDRERPPLKRLALDAAACRPFKRQRGVLNPEYLELLNRDIDDAAQRVCLDDDVDLPHSQVGLTSWSPVEKRQLYEALGRLGRHDLPGIASRVNSKSLLEIKHYLNFLQEAHTLRRQLNRRSFLSTAEYPAAVEFSQQCCHAQEEAADDIALRQEQRETQREEKKWGALWNITPKLAMKLDRAQDAERGQSLRFAQLFDLAQWLKLSEELFMNSSVPGSNWSSIDHVLPSMWATTFDDFYSLAVSVTRRLVQTTLFVSMSRIRAKKQFRPTTRSVVKRRDAEAAVASLGMVPQLHDFWMKSARRLRLDVYQDPPERAEEGDEGDEGDEEPMTYDQVEDALCEAQDDVDQQGPEETIKFDPLPKDSDSDWDTANDFEQDEPLPDNAEEEDEINQEVNEVLWHSAVNLRDVKSTRRALKQHIAMERWQEAQAERCDEYASYQAETEMWSVLQRPPPMHIPKKQDPGRPERSNLHVESIYPVSRDWTSQLEYRSEWETWDAADDRAA